MSLQFIDKRLVYVVEFDTMPTLPITGFIPGEREYEILTAGDPFMVAAAKLRTQGRYARVLQEAIETGVITEPGKYAIRIGRTIPYIEWEVFTIIEKVDERA